MLLTPDSFPDDWYGWITNQSGHVLLGIVIAAITGRLWPVIVVSVTAEFIQWSPDIVDSITDIAFTVVGGFFYITLSNVSLYGIVLALIAGVLQRRK